MTTAENLAREFILGFRENFRCPDVAPSEYEAVMAKRLYEVIAPLETVMHWAQATLTALNVGDVKKDSLLHLKLREVMIAFREKTYTSSEER